MTSFGQESAATFRSHLVGFLMMFSPRFAALGFPLGLVASALVAQATSRSVLEAEATRAVRAHVMFLGDDLLEGRGAGTRGYELAAAYVVAQFRALGLQPAGEGGTFEQPVALLETIRDVEAAAFRVSAAGAEPVVLKSPADFLARPAMGLETAKVSGPAVFVGFGIHAPEHGYSDFEGIDLTGKIAVIFPNSPAKLPGNAFAHYSNLSNKAAELARRGAIGFISVGSGNTSASSPAGTTSSDGTTPESRAAPAASQPSPGKAAPTAGAWNGSIAGARNPQMALLDADGRVVDDTPQIQVVGSLNPARAEAIFAKAAHSYEQVTAASRRSEPLSTPLNVEFEITAAAKFRRVACRNLLATLPGSDPSLANDYIVVSCHLDHLGIGPAINGDSINNGVMDNATGVAAMLAAARQLATSGPKTRRPILFGAVTAEEKGLLGSRHLSRHPPAGGRFAANINLDMGPYFAPLRSIIGYGMDHTTLGALLEAAAAKFEWTVAPDPNPTQRIFVRSDQYSFIREGVPAIFLHPAAISTDPAIDLAALNREFMRTRYHKRSDDLQQPIHYESIGAFAVLAAEVIRAAADADPAPRWHPDDFFGELFGQAKR